MAEKPEVWLRGSVDGYDPFVMPVVHALLQAREDIEQLAAMVPADLVWTRHGGASIGFHVRHLGGALDRLFTYSRGENLSDIQKAAARGEGDAGDPPASLDSLVAGMTAQIDAALAYLRSLKRDDLLEARPVGRAALPANTLGLIFHAAEHCTRHAGQAITTAKMLMADI